MEQPTEPTPEPGPQAARPGGAGGGVLRALVVGVVVVGVAVIAGGALLRPDATPATATSGAAAPGQAVPLLSDRPAADARFPLPERTVEGFAGGPPVDLAGYRGRPLVVNFWATWCPPCVSEMPHFNAVAAEVDDEVAFLGVDVQDAPRRAEPFVAELGIGYELAVDPDRELFTAVGGFGMPTTLFVDAEGTVVHRATGPLDAEGLRAAIAEHLGVAT